MSQQVHRSPIAAWHHLCKFGRIELEGRDEGLDKTILRELSPTATCFTYALSKATMEEFTRAFLATIHPFANMFRDILEFFERAQANEGQDQWILRVDDIDISLEHFRTWIGTWSRTVRLDVACLDHDGAWALLDVLRQRPEVEHELERARNDLSINVAADVVRWSTAYQDERYTPLPSSLRGPRFPLHLRKSALVADSVLLRLRTANISRKVWPTEHRPRRTESDPAELRQLSDILQIETDHWLRWFIVALSAASTHLAHQDLKDLGTDLNDVMVKFNLWPNAPLEVQDLESVLSLPIWKKRYELFAVWVAAEIIRALEAFQVKLHHDDGRMEFGFREAKVASLRSSLGEFALMTERRTCAKNLRGEGRKRGVQPDYALWSVNGDGEDCRLVIEVKHYKKPHRQRFTDVFEDYARAFPRGQIYLVNYGSAGRAIDSVSVDVRDRCHAIGGLMTSDESARSKLASAVRCCVGDPITTLSTSQHCRESAAVLLLDVSMSMNHYIRSPSMKSFVERLLRESNIEKLAAADTTVINLWPATRDGCNCLLQTTGSNTELSPPVRLLLQSYEHVLVITDADGIDTLSDQPTCPHVAQAYAPKEVLVRLCSSSSSTQAMMPTANPRVTLE